MNIAPFQRKIIPLAIQVLGMSFYDMSSYMSIPTTPLLDLYCDAATEINKLRAQVKVLTKERNRYELAMNKNADCIRHNNEHISALTEQVATLSAQTEKMRNSLQDVDERAFFEESKDQDIYYSSSLKKNGPNLLYIVWKIDQSKPKVWVEGNEYKFNSELILLVNCK